MENDCKVQYEVKSKVERCILWIFKIGIKWKKIWDKMEKEIKDKEGKAT